MRAEEPFLVRHADLVFALKTFAASMLALVIALAIDLPRPYWAMATVYILSLIHIFAPAVGSRVRSWLSDARRLSRDVLLDHGSSETRRAQRLRLATDIVEIDTLATHLAYDRLADAGTVRGLAEVRLRMLMLLPIVTSIEDRLAALGEAALQQQPCLLYTSRCV